MRSPFMYELLQNIIKAAIHTRWGEHDNAYCKLCGAESGWVGNLKHRSDCPLGTREAYLEIKKLIDAGWR